jgi:hypothetical protein
VSNRQMRCIFMLQHGITGCPSCSHSACCS